MVYLIGVEATQCPQSFGFFLHFFLCILVISTLTPSLKSFFLFTLNFHIEMLEITINICDFSLYSLPLNDHFHHKIAAKMLCYCRMVYMPMSYLYGKRFVGPITPLILQLREELFTQPYHEIHWNKVRHLCAKVSFSTF